MAHYFKSDVVNSEAYPMPEPVAPVIAPAGAPAQMANAPAPEVLIGTAFALDQIVQLVQQLQPDVERLSNIVRQQAHAQGYEEGLAEARAELQVQLAAATDALMQAQRERHTLAQQHSAELAELALKIARKVIGGQLVVDPQTTGQIVERTIAELAPSSDVTVRVNPGELETVQSREHDLQRLIAGGGSISIIADESVDRGGCIISSAVGEIDARIETKLGVLEQAFAAQRPSTPQQ